MTGYQGRMNDMQCSRYQPSKKFIESLFNLKCCWKNVFIYAVVIIVIILIASNSAAYTDGQRLQCFTNSICYLFNIETAVEIRAWITALFSTFCSWCWCNYLSMPVTWWCHANRHASLFSRNVFTDSKPYECNQRATFLNLTQCHVIRQLHDYVINCIYR